MTPLLYLTLLASQVVLSLSPYPMIALNYANNQIANTYPAVSSLFINRVLYILYSFVNSFQTVQFVIIF